jgi:tetratricopeptide (TPR) repeat protein
MPTYAPSRRFARALPICALLLFHSPALQLAAQSMTGGNASSTTAGGGAPAATVAELLAQADKESVALRASAALPLYERALTLDPKSLPALIGATREAVDLGEFERAESVRTPLYARATQYGRRAVALAPDNADAHFHLARAIGRTALALGPRDKVKYAIEVRDEALKAVALAPTHPGALHVLGVWNAEVLRLNALERGFAKAFLGGKVLGSANWPDAARYLERAVAVEPTRLVHRLDLARIYRDMGRTDDARAAYEAALRCPLQDANDARYRDDAANELKRLNRR